MNDNAFADGVAESVMQDGVDAVISTRLTRLISSAEQAPSGDNSQPWKISARLQPLCIEFNLDPTRDCSPMNSGQRMALIACGAAIENVLLLARESGYRPQLEWIDQSPAKSSLMDSGSGGPGLIARVKLSEPIKPTASDHVERIIAERMCNRRPYDGRPVSPLIIAELQDATRTSAGIRTHWITDSAARDALSNLIGDADAIMFGEGSMRSAFLANVRFDLPPGERAEEGLPLASLEISKVQGAAMRAAGALPDLAFRALGGAAMFSAHARRLVKSSSGLCLITADDDTDHAELRTGQALQRAWLALTELGLSVQPMISLMVLENAMRHGDSALISKLVRRGAARTVSEFRDVAGLLGVAGNPRFLLRFGYAAEPSGRTGRRGQVSP
jgi:hypothetical protein